MNLTGLTYNEVEHLISLKMDVLDKVIELDRSYSVLRQSIKRKTHFEIVGGRIDALYNIFKEIKTYPTQESLEYDLDVMYKYLHMLDN